MVSRLQALPDSKTCPILPGTSSFLNLAGRSAARCGMCKSPITRTRRYAGMERVWENRWGDRLGSKNYLPNIFIFCSWLHDSSHHCLALMNSWIQGPYSGELMVLCFHVLATLRTNRSGSKKVKGYINEDDDSTSSSSLQIVRGIMARNLPHGDVKPVNPPGEPLGL